MVNLLPAAKRVNTSARCQRKGRTTSQQVSGSGSSGRVCVSPHLHPGGDGGGRRRVPWLSSRAMAVRYFILQSAERAASSSYLQEILLEQKYTPAEGLYVQLRGTRLWDFCAKGGLCENTHLNTTITRIYSYYYYYYCGCCRHSQCIFPPVHCSFAFYLPTKH